MIKKWCFVTVCLIFLITIFVSCTQEEGIGGNATIKGQLTELVYNDDMSLLLDEIPVKSEDVFLLFGSDKSIGEDTETSFTGHFTFEYLWPGTYTIYYYSDDTTGIKKDNIEITIPITLKKGEKHDLGKLYRYKLKDWDDGNAVIRGRVFSRNYKNSSHWPNLEIKDVTPAQEQEVYLTYGNHTFYDERIRTQEDGGFEFKNLIKGKYRIVIYSEDLKGSTAKDTVELEFTITDEDQVIEIDEIIFIENL